MRRLENPDDTRSPWTTTLVLRELEQDDTVWSVYDRDPLHPSAHFDEEWWTRTMRLREYRHFVLDSAGQEVARIMVKQNSQVFEGYDGPHAGARATEVVFVEVHRDLRVRFHGIGRTAVELVCRRFPGVVFAKADGAQGRFWERLGWREYRRQEHPERGWRVFVRHDKSETRSPETDSRVRRR